MFCQSCGARNDAEQEACWRCQQKLLVLSGPGVEEAAFETEAADENFSFDEHLLERISILEEAVKRTAETLRQALQALGRQERSLVAHQAGLGTLRDLLGERRILSADEWGDRWRARMDDELLALEKRERFVELRDRITGLYRGDRRKAFDEQIENAEFAFAALEVERAVAALTEAYKLDRDNYELAYFLGETCFNEGDSERALPYFERVLEMKDDHYESLVYSGVIHHEQGDGARAEERLKRAVELYPDAFFPSFSLGAVYAGRGQLARAEALLEKAASIEPLPQALFLLGSCLYEMGRLGAAIDRLQGVVRRDPAHEEAHHLLGLAYLDRGWHRKALESFRAAERLNPTKIRYQDLVRFVSGAEDSPLPPVSDPARRLLERGEEDMSAGLADRALLHYRRAADAEPDNPTVLVSYALACLAADRSRETEAVTRRILDLEPGEMLRATAYATLIEALRSAGRYREGNTAGRELLEQGTSNFARTIAYYEMAYNLAEMEEDLDQALEYAEQSLDLAPEELRQFPLAALGWVHYKRGEYDRAVECLSRSNELGRSTTTLTHLGMALLAAGERGRARTVLAEARAAGSRDDSIESRMMECVRASDRLHARLRRRRRDS